MEKKVEQAIKVEVSREPVYIYDEGWRAWFTVSGSFLSVVATYGYAHSYGVYQDFYVHNFLTNEPSSIISITGSLSLALMFWIGPFAGHYVDRGYFRVMTIVGSVIYIFSMFMLSLARPNDFYRVFLSQGVGMGIGMGLLYVPSLSILSHHFRKRRSLALGISIAGVSVGGIVFSLLLNFLLHHPKLGFAMAVRMTAVIAGSMLVLANILMTPRLPPKSHKSNNLWPTLSKLLKDPSFLWTVLSSYPVTLGCQFPTFYLQLFAVTHGASTQVSYNLLAILNASGTLGRVLPSFLADAFGPFNVYVPWLFVLAASLAAVAGVHNSTELIAVAIFLGFMAGGYVSLSGTVLAGMSETEDEVGTSIGAGFFLSGIAVMTGPPIMGALLSSDMGWIRPIAFSTICIFVGAIATIRGHVLSRRKRGTQRL